MRSAALRNEPVRGIYGPCPLLRLTGLDLVWGIVPDYMHCVLEGVIKQLTEIWFTDTGSGSYIGTFIGTVNDRLTSIRPPNIFSRLPKSIGERNQWKAREWRYWLLYYCMPCLAGILPRKYFIHLTLFCQAIFLLLKKSVNVPDIRVSQTLLDRFVEQVSTLYGNVAATSNVHILVHLPKSVLQLGPLWATSMFPFESANGILLELITAAKGVPQQIVERCAMQQTLRDLSDGVEFPKKLGQIFRSFIKARVPHENGCLGAPLTLELTETASGVVQSHFGMLPVLEKYLRANVQGFEVNSVEYTRCKKTCRRFVKMTDGNFCEIQAIYKCPTEAVFILLCKCLVISDAGMGSAQYIYNCCIPPEEENLCIHTGEDVENICVFIKFQGASYICDMPNFYERE